jgi:hypothetical protein
MSSGEVAALGAALKSTTRYLEYGAGGSTRLAATVDSLESITTVESDPVFITQRVSTNPAVAAAVRSGRLKFLIVDIGPTSFWGRPVDQSKRFLWPNYALCPYMHGDVPELILIDGRFRVACGIVAALAAPEAAVFIHDYPARLQYHILEQFFLIEEVVDTLARCRRHPEIDAQEAERLLSSFLYVPD